jgi:uncharacterized repeat protein (TIGR01451 family)
MNKLIRNQLVLFLGMLLSGLVSAQQSINTVQYKITYDQVSSKYTVWVIPEYNVPNVNNSESTEKGATAQVTLAVPKDFIISNILDINGLWEKAPLKFGPGQINQNWNGYGLDPNTNYYVIGKDAAETNYGAFTSGTDVPLFSFQGNNCLGLVRIIEPNERFISAANDNFSLNTANSFYSRSGQPAGGNQNPLEQFRAVVGGPANCNTTPRIKSADLKLTKTVSSSSASLNDVLTYTVTVINNGPDAATNIRINDQLPSGLLVVANSTTTSKGTWSSPLWTIPVLASGESATLSFNAQIIVEGLTINKASVVSLDQVDTDLNNNSSYVCTSVPIVLCQGESIEVSVPTEYSNVKWFKDGQQTVTGNNATITTSGTYSITASSGSCPVVGGCCPIVVVSQVCCPEEFCVPITIKKIR